MTIPQALLTGIIATLFTSAFILAIVGMVESIINSETEQ